MKKRILVTGGAGYIGSHTIVDLVQNGYDVVAIDNFSNSDESLLNGAELILGQRINFHNVDLRNIEDIKKLFEVEKNIDGIIHFAAFKSVPESVDSPLLYYKNNINALVNLLEISESESIKHFVFSSSCSVYGDANTLPVSEITPLKEAVSPYGRSKQMGESIIQDLAKISQNNYVMLRYFNPVGAHESAKIGEIPKGKPSNLIPVITQTAIGKIDKMYVWGTDYNTKDGSCIRDFVHVSDIAHAHTLALAYSIQNESSDLCEIFNLGTGDGVSIFEALNAFEKVSNIKLNVEWGPRREGDVIEIFADNEKAKSVLGWNPKFGIEEMMRTAWAWEQRLNQ